MKKGVQDRTWCENSSHYLSTIDRWEMIDRKQRLECMDSNDVRYSRDGCHGAGIALALLIMVDSLSS